MFARQPAASGLLALVAIAPVLGPSHPRLYFPGSQQTTDKPKVAPYQASLQLNKMNRAPIELNGTTECRRSTAKRHLPRVEMCAAVRPESRH